LTAGLGGWVASHHQQGLTLIHAREPTRGSAWHKRNYTIVISSN
jgi:hypothetical protein